MTTLDALLDDIRANPEDDLPRLALADWCMEQADPAAQARGEFIHLRCRAAALPLGDPERTRLEHRARRLAEDHAAAWLEGLAGLAGGWTFERGMILLDVTGRHSLARMSRTPGWKWVIGIRGVLLQPLDVERIAGSELLAHLTSLNLEDCPLRADGARLLAVSPHARHLSALRLGYAQIGDTGLRALAESPHLRRLSVLTLGNNGIGRAGVSALANAVNLRRLAHLDLSRNPLGDEGVRALLAGTGLPGLRRLLLESCDVRDGGSMALAGSGRLAGLELLDVSGNRLNAASRAELRERFGERVRL